MAMIQLKRPLAPDHVPGPLTVCPLLPDQQRADDLETIGWAHPGLLPSTLPITARLNATWYQLMLSQLDDEYRMRVGLPAGSLISTEPFTIVGTGGPMCRRSLRGRKWALEAA